jgi:hypothetical protein
MIGCTRTVVQLAGVDGESNWRLNDELLKVGDRDSVKRQAASRTRVR